MSIEVLTIVMFGAFFLLLALGLPLAWVTLTLGLAFGFMIDGSPVFQFLVFRTWDIMNSFSFIAIPLFIFMANMLQYSGVAEEMFDAIYRWLGPLKGGLGVAAVIACTILAAMVGTVGAGVTIMGLTALPAMLKRKYSKTIALGSIMAGGTLGIMIPPSIVFIIYGVQANQSVGKLLIGGVGPGLMLASLYMVYILIVCYIKPSLGPELSKEERTLSTFQKLALVRTLILPAFLILAVLGSIYLGLATPGEAAGVGAAGALVVAAVRGQLNWKNLKLALFSSMNTVGVVMWIVFGAVAFIGVYTTAGGSKFIADWMAALPLGRWGILILTQVMLIILGMVLDPIGIIILTVPIFVPVIRDMGFDPLWYGIVFNVNLQIAFLSPPFGYAMFYLKAVSPKDVTTIDLYRAVVPFIILQVLGLALTMAFPAIAVWLPNQMIR